MEAKNIIVPRMEWLQALRAFAALAVVLFHTKDAFTEYPVIQKIFAQGFFGVDIFFCLSGYIMCLSCSQKAPGMRNGLRFLLTRGARIYSGYWLALLLTLSVTASGVGAALTGDWFASVFLTSTLFNDQFLHTAWTLVYELRFYLAIGLLYFFFSAKLSVRNITVIASLIVLYNLGFYAFALDSVMGGVWPLRSTLNGFFLEFMFGMYIFMLNQKKPLQLENCLFLIPVAILLLAAGTFNILFANFEFLRAATYGLASMAILAFFIALENQAQLRPFAWIVKIGDASYSLYLIHPILLSLLFTVLYHYLPIRYFYVFYVIGIVLIVLASWVWFKVLEKPIYEWVNARISVFFASKSG